MQKKFLRRGTLLHHGTASPVEFDVPTGPAWFCLDWVMASGWAGWASHTTGGEKRVLTLRLKHDVELVDTTTRKQWEQVSLHLCGELDQLIWGLVRVFQRHGLAGWYGRAEVMLCNTACLEHVEDKSVDPDWPFRRPRKMGVKQAC